MASDDILRIFIGYDQREDEAYWVCQASIARRTSLPVCIEPLKLSWLSRQQLFSRPFTLDGKGQRKDVRDGKPFSTDFAFTRFLVPHLMDYQGWAVFCDCDFLFLADIAELFAQKDDRYAVQVVMHDHRPVESTKMDGQIQATYRRKNWSSLVLWNCGHPSNRVIDPGMVNTQPGSWLHAFDWLKDDEIGSLSAEWNWLEGSSPPIAHPKAVHYTRGTPVMPGYENCGFADEWRRERAVIEQSRMMMGGKIVGSAFAFPQKPFARPRAEAAE